VDPVAADGTIVSGQRPAVDSGLSALTHRLRSLLAGFGSTTSSDPLAELVREHRTLHPAADCAALRRAYEIAEAAHRGQVRKSGEPYITHPLAVAQILAALGMDTTTLVAALLHDTIEDTSYDLAELDRDFGAEVALLVDGVTKFEKVSYGDYAEAETVRKMIVAAGRDVRVLIIKLADRLHNTRTLAARSPASRQRIARNTRDVLVPLCDRLGIQAFKRELEDGVLFHLEPEAYAKIGEHLENRPSWTEYLASVTTAAKAALRRHKVTAEVSPRPRHFYSIWKDTSGVGHREPYELPRIVIIVDGPDTDCYAALGAMHGAWRPVPGRFKDFIASPKNNLYRSLHTTVIGPDDKSVEVLIRTEAMHQRAEYGVIANYRFPELADSADADELAWLHRLLGWQHEAADPDKFLAALHTDLTASQVHVFTPGGRQMLLPVGATPVDLAYALDTHLGDHCVAATVNGRLVPLSSALVDGDVVEVLTDEHDRTEDSGGHGPAREWLDSVKTPHAQLQISRWFNEHHRDDGETPQLAEQVRLGRAAIGLALRERERGLTSDVPLLRLATTLGYPDLDALFVAVAEHTVSAEEVVEALIASVDHG
jgi:GTP pyrophosphokinase